jgi:thymidylate synthase
MKQYHDLLYSILENGTRKAPARENMPGTLSLFGHQIRIDLQQGFPILTTKKLSFKNIVHELLWFLNGDTNIKYLVDHGCNIWNEDSFNFYTKLCKEQNITNVLDFDNFVQFVKNCENYNDLSVNSKRNSETDINGNKPCIPKGYVLGDCGRQYGWLWRRWERYNAQGDGTFHARIMDQLQDLITGLKSNPEGRRHIITAWNPATLDQMALNACHALVQFNCRQLTLDDRIDLFLKYNLVNTIDNYSTNEEVTNVLNELEVPKYYLDCQLYQRSADVFLGVPYNIASYALLTHILCEICNMVPGEYIHTFGDVHIYENHMDAVNEQLLRDVFKYDRPTLIIDKCPNIDWQTATLNEILASIKGFETKTFSLDDYKAYPTIKAELSTGLKK